MEGPYRDLGAGFARLAGAEGARRSPSHISSVEDALLELLRNARDAKARNIYVASSLRARRYRILTVLDDGVGIPKSHADLVFEPGVTTRHLNPILINNDPAPHGAGLSLYQIKNATTDARVNSNMDPTSVSATFDTRSVPERSLQSTSRRSDSNLRATLVAFLENTPSVNIYFAAPARILSTLIKHGTVRQASSEETQKAGVDLGLHLSLRTVQRIIRGEIGAVKPVSNSASGERAADESADKRGESSEVQISLAPAEIAELEAILRRIVQARYLDLGQLKVESRSGEISLRIDVYEPEDEYD